MRQLPPESDFQEADQYSQKYDWWAVAIVAQELVVGLHPCPDLEDKKFNIERTISDWVKQDASKSDKYPAKMTEKLDADFAEFIRHTICELEDRWGYEEITACAQQQKLNAEYQNDHKIQFFD